MRRVLLVLASAAAGVIAGCGPAPSAGPGAGPAVTPGTSRAAAPRAEPVLTLPPVGSLHPAAGVEETIVVRRDGTVDTYLWLPGGAGRAEYVTTAAGVTEGSWTADGSPAGTYQLACDSAHHVVTREHVSGRKNPVSLDLGTVGGACVGGRITALSYAEGFAKNGHWAYVVIRS